MKKSLLASTALVGAALLAAPASAGTVGSKDDMAVSLAGAVIFSVNLKDQDRSAGRGRGYNFNVNETEVHVNASNTADNGIKYGVSIEFNAGGGDTTVADEVWAFIDSEVWGRIEMGDQDDATNVMQVGSWNAHKGWGGPIGGLAMPSNWGTLGGETLNMRADWQPLTTNDETKVVYFSPRFEGFQIGASLTPDTGEISGQPATLDTDNDGDWNNVMDIGVNYAGKFDEVGVGFSIGYQWGEGESASGASHVEEDLEILGIGGRVDFAGFTIGAHYRDYGDTGLTSANARLGADQGTQWSVGVGYGAGPWGISAWYLTAEKNNTSTSPSAARTTEVTRFGLGAGYNVAPGWLLRADIEWLDHQNIGGTRTGSIATVTPTGVGTTTDNDGTAFMLTNLFSF
ncbi:MAG: porin [Rhodospirillaceae bacterium]